jgi:hypothetical protein
MRLYVETMDAVVVEGREGGTVRYEREGWSTPSFQERRAIIHAAEREIEALTELLEFLDDSPELGSRRG